MPGHSDPTPRPNRITVTPDRLPTVELLKPARQSSASPGGEVPVMIRAFGRSRPRSPAVGNEDPGGNRRTAKPEKRQTTAGRRCGKSRPKYRRRSSSSGPIFSGDSITTAVRHHTLELKPDLVKPGQTVLIRVVAYDKRVVTDWGLDLRSQESASGWHAIKVVAEDAKASAALEQIENLRGAIYKILEKQIQSRSTLRRITAAIAFSQGKTRPPHRPILRPPRARVRLPIRFGCRATFGRSRWISRRNTVELVEIDRRVGSRGTCVDQTHPQWIGFW